jgi:putative phosphoribosyl transferase
LVSVGRKGPPPHNSPSSASAPSPRAACVVVIEPERARRCDVDDAAFEQLAADARARVDERVHRYRARRKRQPLTGRTVIVVDDGVAKGVIALAALVAVREQGPARVVFAVPIAAADVADIVGDRADQIVAVLKPGSFRAVGEFLPTFRTDD